jgi:hypothetical protein
MKNILLMVLICAAIVKVKAQNQNFPIFDYSLKLAEDIRKYKRLRSQKDSVNISKSKISRDNLYNSLADFMAKTGNIPIASITNSNIYELKKNKFLFNALDSFFFRKGEFTADVRMMEAEKNTGGLLKTLGNFNATIYADAFAKIIVKRFKQDMNALFFNKMKAEMDKSIELKTLFPNTYGGLSLMDKDIYAFNQYIEGLRQKVEEDLANIFANTTALLETEEYTKVFKGSQTVRGFLTTVTQFADGLIRNEHPGHIIENLHFSDAFDVGEGQDLKAGLQTIQLFSAGFRQEKDPTHYWVHSLDSLNLLFKGDGLAAQIWIGILYELAVDENGTPIIFQNGKTLRHYINSLYDEKDYFFHMRSYVQGLIRRVNNIEMSIDNMKQTDGTADKLYWDKMVASYQNVLSLVKFAPTIKDIIEPEAALPRLWYKGLYIAEALPRIYAEMKGREYHAAIQHITDLLEATDTRPLYIKKDNKGIRLDTASLFFNTMKDTIPIREYKSFSGTYFKHDNKPILINKIYTDPSCTIELDNSVLRKFIKYSSFAASLVLAQSSDEVANLLESTMTSSGGTHVKESGWLLSVNSYLGVQNTFKKKDTLGFFSISAPIGLNLSYGFNRKPTYALKEWGKVGDILLPHTVQFFASIIDVGAIAGFRFTNGADSIPKVKLSNIFSPGIFVQFGRIFKSPLNIGFGYQAQPRLYAIKEESILLKKFQYRFNMNLSWDIPFWHLKHWGQN